MSVRLKVGVEIHARVTSVTKLFSRSSASARDPLTGRPPAPNSLVGWLDCALPGAMPKLNEQCVNQAIITGLAFGGRIQPWSLFERKHYFYCDSPLGYQITQQSFPIVLGGSVKLNNDRIVNISRIQLEQDTAKSFHSSHQTLVDFNRAGVALMEIVSEPDMQTPLEASEYVQTVQRILRHIGSCDGNMEDGSLRADINVSVHDSTGKRLSHRVEVKNLNSLRSIERAVTFEKSRLESLVSSRKGVDESLTDNSESSNNETRGFDVKTGETFLLREKEGQVDYRFMADPDLPPLIVSQERIDRLKRGMVELPDQIRERYLKDFGLRRAEIEILVLNPALSKFFEYVVQRGGDQSLNREAIKASEAPPTLVANLLCNNVLGALRKIIDLDEVEDLGQKIDADDFRSLCNRLHTKQVSMQRAKELINEKLVKKEKIIWEQGPGEMKANPSPRTTEAEVLVAGGQTQNISQDRMQCKKDQKEIERVCEEVLTEYEAEVAKYRDGKTTLINFFFGKAFAKLKQQGKVAVEVDQVKDILNQVLAKFKTK